MNEFQFIDNIRAKFALRSIGDDCAVMPKDSETDLLLTADMLIEDIDFEIELTRPEFIGHKALAVSLSDIAAMGGEAKWSMLSIGVPQTLWETDFVEKFYDGWFALARLHGVELVGGDVSRSPEKLVIDCVAGGEVARGKAFLRSGAKPGDAIYVTGPLGGAAGGLKLSQRGFVIDDDILDVTTDLLTKLLKPTPQLAAAKVLQTMDVVTSMIDLSDGLSSDLAHICRESGVGASIYKDRLPVDKDIGDYFHSDICMEMALDGGEDFQLLFTVDEKNISRLETSDFRRIGDVTANVGSIELIGDGESTVLEPKGYRHF